MKIIIITLSAFLTTVAAVLLHDGYTAPQRSADEYMEQKMAGVRSGNPALDDPLEQDPNNYNIAQLKNRQDDYILVGTMESCTGWILFGAACIVFSIGQISKTRPSA